MGTRYSLLIGSLLLLAACDGCQPYPYTPPTPPRPDPVVDADCSAVCDRGRELGCEFGNPESGTTCESVCAVSSEWWDMPCLAGMTSCEQQEACVVGE